MLDKQLKEEAKKEEGGLGGETVAIRRILQPQGKKEKTRKVIPHIRQKGRKGVPGGRELCRC